MAAVEAMDPDAPPGDEELVLRARAGDQAAARALVDRHAASLRARVRARLPVALRARVGDSDVLQEAYVTAFRRLAEFEDRGEGSFERWMARILEHKIHDEIRRHVGSERRAVGREVSCASSTGVWPRATDPGPSPSAAASAREAHEDIESVLAGMPDLQGQILRMVHGKGLALCEVARLLGKSPEAVRQTYGRAIAAYSARLSARERGPAGPAREGA